MLVGYARVSTGAQNLDGQIDRLREAGCDRIFEEVASGAKVDRPVLEEALSYCRAGDTFVCLSLSRVARSVQHLIQIVADFEERDIGFKSLTETIDTTTPAGRMLFTVMAACSQMERDLLVERTNIGLQAARKRGRLGGRPKKMSDVQIASAKDMFAKEIPAAEIASAFGVSVPTLYRTIPAKNR
ncbi:recombinase family protein [Phaeobacter inhibens]|uniref:Resolvase n=1 Tax=Phaeobacter inhibens TaxID=221822 RepID=A0A2I7KDX3_9RHOB|nr:recombinase family protein [Phaeobacter inhibens]AUR00797.1 resolvase [Phaeobacter inhibens]